MCHVGNVSLFRPGPGPGRDLLVDSILYFLMHSEEFVSIRVS